MESKKALFLDRDGVINVEKNYLYKKEDFEFIDGIFELCRYFAQKGYLIFVVTNQSGIARGYYTQEQFLELTAFMEQEFLNNGISIAKTYFCPHHPQITGECSCRKPKPGMLLEAQKEFNVDVKNSLMVGDKERDIEAAHNAGVLKRYLFSSEIKTSNATKIVKNLREIIGE